MEGLLSSSAPPAGADGLSLALAHFLLRDLRRFSLAFLISFQLDWSQCAAMTISDGPVPPSTVGGGSSETDQDDVKKPVVSVVAVADEASTDDPKPAATGVLPTGVLLSSPALVVDSLSGNSTGNPPAAASIDMTHSVMPVAVTETHPCSNCTVSASPPMTMTWQQFAYVAR